jgi:hypothetical protein
MHALLVEEKNLDDAASPPLMIRKQPALRMQRDLLWVTCRIPSGIQFARGGSDNDKSSFNR